MCELLAAAGQASSWAREMKRGVLVSFRLQMRLAPAAGAGDGQGAEEQEDPGKHPPPPIHPLYSSAITSLIRVALILSSN